MFARRFLAGRTVLALASLLLVPAGAVLSIRAFADDEASAGPTCCAKKAYYCTVKARCCDKRAYCCKIKSPCCGKEFDIEVMR